MSNGKGSRPRNNHSEAFRANYEAIKWNKESQADVETMMKKAGFRRDEKGLWYSYPSLPSKPRKSQGNGPSGAAGGQGKGHK